MLGGPPPPRLPCWGTATVPPAPAPASARAVSTPIPDEAPVTMARLPDNSTPAMTSAAVDEKPKGVVIKSALMSLANSWLLDRVPRRGDRAFGLLGDASDQRTSRVHLVDQINSFTG